MTVESNTWRTHRAGGHAPALKRFDHTSFRSAASGAFSNGSWCDVANLIVGAFLFSSPWVLGFGGPVTNVATRTAGVLGAVIAVTSVAALRAFEAWEEYILVLASALAILSPAFIDLPGSAAVTVGLSGIATLALASSRLWLLRQTAPDVR
ncbi:SPW repeat domain-containing protein [Bradyrhizobium oligotrophicum]|uniref:SPW repeat domain-containing protein n=1 Tax=Bradyrhizobium oligotrophicum TaxID=44255 RepID=UPI003EB870B1